MLLAPLRLHLGRLVLRRRGGQLRVEEPAVPREGAAPGGEGNEDVVAAEAGDPFELRAVDIAISDDMLCCLDALRWGCADLYTLVPDGDARVRAVIDCWGLRWPEAA